MIEAQTDVVIGEAIEPAGKAHALILRGHSGIVVAALVFAAVLIATIGLALGLPMLSPALMAWTGAITLVGLVAALGLAIRISGRRQVSAILAGVRAMGAPAAVPTRFRFDTSGIDVASARVSHQIPWPAVLFIIPAEHYWLVQVDTLTIAIPRRAFADSAAEKAFLELASANLSPDAVGRSVLATH